MRFAFLRPVNGWRGFVTELAIVVLGVLIALTAQQAVDGWQGKRNVADFRAALDTELADSLLSYQGRAEQSACLNTRLDQLEQWQLAWRDGNGPGLDGEIGRPLAFSLSFSVWRTGAASVAARMPLRERLACARLYDGLESYDVLRLREADVWQKLFAYDGATRLSPPEVNQLRGFILSARSIDRSMRLNYPGFEKRMAELGIARLPSAPEWKLADNGLCPPLRFDD